MTVSTKVAAIVVSGLLFAYAPAHAQATQATPSTGTITNGQSMLGLISPLLNTSVEHKAAKNCKPDTLYSQHNVIGDPDACLVSKADVRAGAASGGAVAPSF